MIPRYSRKKMVALWEPQNCFQIWLDIELAALEGLEKIGGVPKGVAASVSSKAKFSIDRIDVLEQELKHDVLSFLTCVSEHGGPNARYLHKGMTSSDVLDTALALQLKQASDIILEDLDELLSVLKKRAYEFKDTPQIGRSHGIHAEPTTFGLKLARWYEELKRDRARFVGAREEIAVGKISGAVGNFANIDPAVEAHVCKKLGLKADPISTQIIGRDRHAHFFSTIALIGSTLEEMAVEIRHLQRTEVYEVEEFFSKGQKGSSAMPHKRNPVLTENISGLARLLRGYATASLENVALWHERDISHSSVERVIAPDATILIDFMLSRMTQVIKNLLVYPAQMRANIDRTHGLIFSQRVLLALVDKGIGREEAYKLVQSHALKVWESGVDFLTELKGDTKIKTHLKVHELESLFDIQYYMKHVDTLMDRVFGKK